MYEILESRYIWQSRWYNLRQDLLRDGCGREFSYTVVEHPITVAVLPVLRDGRVLLIRQYRYPVNEYCIEIPAGGIGDDPDPESAARRELIEEIGGTAADLRPVGRYFASNGVSSEAIHLFLATGVELGPANREPTEEIELLPLPAAEALRLARSGGVSDARCALALLLCEPFLT